MRLMAKLFGILMVVGILIGFYSAYVEPHLLRVKQYDMKFEQVAGNPITVVQFSDTHVGDFFTTEDLKKVVDKINEQQADLVLFTGDLMDNAAEYDGSIDEIATILSKIKATNGKYAVFGNRDYGGGAERFYEDLMESAGFEVLVNSSRTLEVKGTTISLFGADDALIGYYNSNKTMQGISNDHLNLLLIHEPDLISDFLSYPIDLATAGHSHGGQVYIPFYGPLLTTALAEDYVRGLYDFGNNRKTLLYVNTGIGNTKVPFRLFNVPQISVFKLEKAE
ncbi:MULTISPECIES: metallophosphoesterase [Turicibacter]|mgnify:CR=1 FL=1|jgi:ser/thr phosphatase family protein|uniref:Metallophosphoesterase n=2 Tax=Turicibacter sanguinis TaxID=154288 RepID=A0A173RZ01_9FIRM|nr:MULTISPECIES: metallophosphoesterase [Turicibacter]EFF64533.1 Ser/Thr phosphatase family protein [Turicibacter sanguinis PC909]EGC92710.1 Ser/Thr phosphatase family protein [Turicibacter sp. HGF1]MBP3904928.1 metallophosphoesterase [Turicibacter sp.]MCU7190466.1 metallophosphoesterase [Turicibacter sanguinis]MCU7196444.1 metallophosphoesterase [Turicibacter sanguinis]